MSTVNVLAVIESCRDSWGDLSHEGQSLRESHLFSLRNGRAYDDAVQYQARNIKSATDSLRKAGLAPIIRGRR